MAALADSMCAAATMPQIVALSAAAKGRCPDPSFFSLRGSSGLTSSSSISWLSMFAKLTDSAKCAPFSNRYNNFNCKATVATPELKTEQKQEQEQEEESFSVTGVSLKNIQDANRVVYDFLTSYMVLHNLDKHSPEDVFRHLGLLYYLEAQWYKTDDLNEVIGNGAVAADSSEEVASFLRDPVKIFKDVLHQKKLFTEKVARELDTATEYWRLELSMCKALCEGKPLLLEDVVRAVHLKCFDYRVLFLVLYGIRGAPVNSLHMEFMSTLEIIGDMCDDLKDYETDVRRNTFNVFRAFVNIYGPSQAPTEMAKLLDEIERKNESVRSQLEPELADHFARLRKYRTASPDTDNPLVKWNIPPVIADEPVYRASMAANMNDRMEEEKDRLKLVYI